MMLWLDVLREGRATGNGRRRQNVLRGRAGEGEGGWRRGGEGWSGRGLRGGGEREGVVRVNGGGGEGGERVVVWVNGSRANSCCCLEGLLLISFLETCSLWVEVTFCVCVEE